MSTVVFLVMANETWFGKPIENVKNLIINGVSKRVSRYNNKLYKDVDFLNEGRAVKNLDLPEYFKAERCRNKGKRYEMETYYREVTVLMSKHILETLLSSQSLP